MDNQLREVEEKRLQTLHQLAILDTPAEERFDKLTRAAAGFMGVPIALISLVDRERQWFKSKIGLGAGETPRSSSFCALAIQGEDTFVVCDASTDPRFAGNPLVTGDPNIRFYAGQPIVAPDGSKLGTVCVIDRVPRELDPLHREALRKLASDAAAEIVATRITLGSFRVLELLGRGGMGAVYKAEDESLRRVVALKVLLRQHAEDVEGLARLRREAMTLAAISHPNVLTIFHVGEAHGIPFLVFEFMKGGGLDRKLVDGKSLPWREVATLGVQIASGLSAIHEAGLVHRDLKPANILFDAGGRAKVADFGLVRAAVDPAIEPAAATAPEASGLRLAIREGASVEATVCAARDPLWQGDRDPCSTITARGAIQGTLRYMPPEQAFPGRALDRRADLYSLGATLYAALTGHAPLDASTPTGLLAKLAREKPVPVGEIVRDVPKPLERIISKLLEKEPENRPASAEQVANEFEAISRWQSRSSRFR